jgi:hypothetical protein
MPDGALVQFPDDMPADQIRGMILKKFPDIAKKAAPEEPSSSTSGAFARGVEQGALPAAGGGAGFRIGSNLGARAGALAGALIPIAGETGIPEAIGGGLGYLAGGVGGAYLGGEETAKLQQKMFDALPEGVQKKLGLTKEQQQADIKEHKYAAEAGQLAPNLALLRPGKIPPQVLREGATAVERFLATPAGARATGAAFMGGQTAGTEYAQQGTIDPYDVAMAAGLGAISNKPTKLGRVVLGGHAAEMPKVEGEETPDPFAGLPEDVKIEAIRLQQSTGISAEEAVVRAQEELNGLEQANQRPAGNVGDVGPESGVPPAGGENVDTGTAATATGTAGAGLGVPSGATQQAGTGEVNVPGSLDQIVAQQPSAAGEALAREFPKVPVDQTAVEPVKNVINQVAEAPPIKGIPEAAPELPLMQYAEQANAENAKLDNDIAFWEGRDKENQAAAEQPTVPALDLDPNTPRKERTAQAVEAVKAVADTHEDFAGTEVAKKDINKAAQRLVNADGGDPHMALTRVLEGEVAEPKKAKAKVTEEVPFEGTPKEEAAAPKEEAALKTEAEPAAPTVVKGAETEAEPAAPTVVKGAETEAAPKTEAAPDLFSADANPEADPYVRAEAAKETVPPEMTKFPAKREAAPYIEPTPTLEPAKKTKKDKGRIFTGENARAEADAALEARGPQGVTAERARETGDPSYRQLLQRAEGETDAVGGMFSPLEKLIRVALDSKGRLETLHHEAIHAMRKMGLFKDPEWAVLSKRAKDEWIAKYEIKKKYKGDKLTEEQEIEEAVAEAYADYVANKNQGGKTKTLFDRIRNVLKAVVDAVRGAPEDVFRRIEKGEVGRRDRKTATGEAAQGPTYKGSSKYTTGRNAERAQVENALRKRLDELGLHDVDLKVPDSMTVERGEKGVSLQRSKAGEDAAKASNKITEAIDEWTKDDATADGATEAVGNSVKGHDPEAYTKGLDANFMHMGPKVLQKLLSALPGSTIIKWGSKYIPKLLHEVRSLVDTMSAERTNLLRAAGKISTRYKAFVEKYGQKTLSAVMEKARLGNINPTEFANLAEALKGDVVIKHLEGLIAKTKTSELLSTLKSELIERQSRIKEVHDLWDELGKQEGGHELYKEVRQYYKDMYKVLRSRWLENAKAQVKGEDDKKALEASLKAIEDEVQAPDPDYYHGAPKPAVIDQYFPFKRFGNYSLDVRATGTRARSYHRFDTYQQQQAEIAKIAKELGVSPTDKAIFKARLETDEDAYDAKKASKTVQKMYETIDKSQVLGGDLDAAKMELKRQLNEILLENLPARSLGKSQMRAENVPGYSMDFFRVFNTSASGYASQLPRIKYAPKIRDAVKAASLYVENNYPQNVQQKLQLFVDELEKRAEEAISPPKRGAVVSAINRMSFLWLLSSGASAGTQMTSLPIRVLPALGSRYGYGAAIAKMAIFSNPLKSVGFWVTHADGTKSFTWPSMETAPVITSSPLRTRMYKALEDRGVFNDAPTEAITQTGATPENTKLTGESALAQAGAATDKVFRVMTAGFTSAERLSRQITGMSFVEMAYEAKKRPGMDFDQKAFDEAVDAAVTGTRDSLGDYSEFERPRIMNKDLARFVFQFKNYSVTTTKFFLENAHAMLKGETPEVRMQAMSELAGVLLMGGMFFGATGMPLYSTITAATDVILDNLGDDEAKKRRRARNPLTADNSDQRFRREFLPQHFGNIKIPGIYGQPVRLSDMIESGPISAWTDANWSHRTQFNDLWFQQGLQGNTFEESAKNFIIANLGPGVSLGDNFARALDDFSNGDITRGLVKLNPAFTKGIFSAYQLKTEGATTTKGDVILKPADFNDYNLVTSVLGLQSDRLARLQNEAFARTGADVAQKRAKAQLMGRYDDLATHPNTTPEDFKTLFGKVREYNQRYPLLDMQIDMDSLISSMEATLQKQRFSAYGSYFKPDEMGYVLKNIMSAAPPRQ